MAKFQQSGSCCKADVRHAAQLSACGQDIASGGSLAAAFVGTFHGWIHPRKPSHCRLRKGVELESGVNLSGQGPTRPLLAVALPYGISFSEGETGRPPYRRPL